MLAIQNALGPLFALILFGAVLGRINYPGGDFWPRAERFVYYVFFPALLVHTLATADVADVPLVRLAVVCLGATVAVAIGLWLTRYLFASDDAAFTSVFQGALRFNTYVSIAGAGALHGQAGVATAAVVIALLVPTVNLLSVACFIGVGALGRTSLARSLFELLRNPLILACIVGITLNGTGIGLPGWSDPILALIGRPALPLGLIAVGVALRPRHLFRGGRALWLTSLLKLAVVPAIAMVLALVCGLDAVSRDVTLLFTAVSTATSSYILARQLGGDAELMAALITVQTALAMLTLPLWLVLIG
ncbi:auxin efflux carrier [Salinisphaera shabanensis T35B1]|uniref:AEC family transporter n=1 Tax=Salinisphaera shabanensis TaxID=180542 RepID=UPI003340976E